MSMEDILQIRDLYVSYGGIASATIIFSGYQYVSEGGKSILTTISRGLGNALVRGILGGLKR